MMFKNKIVMAAGGISVLFGLFFPVRHEPDWEKMPSFPRGETTAENLILADSLTKKAMEQQPDLFTLLIKVIPITFGVIATLIGGVWKIYSNMQEKRFGLLEKAHEDNVKRIIGLGESFDTFVREDFSGFKDSVGDKYLLKSDFKDRHDEIKLQMDRIEGKVDRLLGKGV